jgi:hypothetical protein
MNKALWMAQAAGAAAPPLLTDHGEFRVDSDASPALFRSLLYRSAATPSLSCSFHADAALCRLSYYRFASLRQGAVLVFWLGLGLRFRVRAAM